MAEDLQAEDFTPFVGKIFQPDRHPQALTLVQVDAPDRVGWDVAPRKPFCLILRGPPGDVVPEGLHRFTADNRQEFELYLVPIQTASRDRQDYQIAFN